MLALAGDVSRSADVEAAVAQARAELGPIDVLVCSAGVPGESLPTVDVTDEEWRRVMGINADGVFFCNRAVIAGMVERGYGRIVNVSSIAGKEGNPMAGAYSASKAAVIAMTKAIGKDVARSGVLVNCVAPAVIDTPILDGITQEHVDYMVERIPMGRIGEPEEVAALDLLARERGVLVLDGRHVRHLRRPGRLLMRYVRVRGPNGVENATVQQRPRRHGRRDDDRAARSRHAAASGAVRARRRRSTRPRCGARASRTSARATRASRRASSRTRTRWSTTRRGRSCS